MKTFWSWDILHDDESTHLILVNLKNIDDVGKILSRGITDNELFYTVYREALKETGQA